jgi:surfeit locus 1 family protein
VTGRADSVRAGIADGTASSSPGIRRRDRAATADPGAATKHRSLIPVTLFWLALFVILIGLGTWQIHRLHWKEGLIAERHAAITGPPIVLPETLAAAKGQEFRHVRLEGRFLNGRELYFNAIADDGTPGFHVVAPFVLDDGKIVFVDRGFVPEDRRNPATRRRGILDGHVAVTGLLRIPTKEIPWFEPGNDVARNLWFHVDLPAMAAADRVRNYLPIYVDADKSQVPGVLPIGGQTYTKLPNNHLQYALTWYGLAGLVPIYYVMFVRRMLKERKA